MCLLWRKKKTFDNTIGEKKKKTSAVPMTHKKKETVSLNFNFV